MAVRKHGTYSVKNYAMAGRRPSRPRTRTITSSYSRKTKCCPKPRQEVSSSFVVMNPKKRDAANTREREKGRHSSKGAHENEVTRTTTLTIHHREHFLPQALLCPPCCATNPKTSDELQAKRMSHHKQAPISQPAIKPSIPNPLHLHLHIPIPKTSTAYLPSSQKPTPITSSSINNIKP